MAQRVSEAASVLLKNNGILPLKAEQLKNIALVGSHADVGVLTGGGSAQVNPPGGNAVKTDPTTVNQGSAGIFLRGPVWWPSSPLKAIRARAHGASVIFNAGSDPAAAAQAARGAEVAIVFANQPSSEGRDLDSLALPDNQDVLITAVANANPHTIVVLETGGAVTMPWLSKVAAVVEIWYPGSRGAEATTNLLFGDVNFTGKLPITFPQTEAELPAPVIAGSRVALVPLALPAGAPPGARARMVLPPFNVPYPEEAAVGYKWYQANRLTPLFPFGFGLSYTHYAYSGLKVLPQSVSFTVRNTGPRDGAETAQVYAQVPDERGRYWRLAGWSKISLKSGESKTVSVQLDPTYLSVWDTARHAWAMPAGNYAISVGPDSHSALLTGGFALAPVPSASSPPRP